MLTQRPIIYNLHRLVDRCSSSTPTGVDRVDLHHALFLIEKCHENNLLFVRQQGSVLRLIPFSNAKNLIQNLAQRWLYSKALAPPKFAHNKLYYIRHYPDFLWRKYRKAYISPGIFTALRHRSENPLYMHSGHGTLHHIMLHQQIKKQLKADCIYYLHDLIPIEFPEYCNNSQAYAMHQRRLETMAHTGSLILANSQDSRQGFLTYCDKHNLPKPPVEVAYIGVEQAIIAARDQVTPLPERFNYLNNKAFFVCIGTIEPRKNHALLIHIWRQLIKEMGDECPKLVIIGKRGWRIEQLMALLERNPRLQQYIIEVNDASDQDIIALLKHANALLFPSFVEGWGMPLAEALTLGTPAICADVPALRECGGDHATYLDPLDGLGWKLSIEKAAFKDKSTFKHDYPYHTWQDHLLFMGQVLEGLV